jgi:Flp pilus assembly protein TadG
MLDQAHVVLKSLCGKFVDRRDGSVMTTFAFALIPLLGLVGAAVDYSRANDVRTSLRKTLDSAVIAGARDGSTNWVNVATNFFNANVQSKGSSVSTPTFALTSSRSYTGSVNASVPTFFLGLLGVNSINVDVTATASVSTNGNYYCVMALNSTAAGALTLSGNASITITAPKCVLQVNSKSFSAVSMNGNTTINSVENCFVGGVSKVGNASISPNPDSSCKAVPDPFAAYPRPTVGPCDHTNFTVAGNQTLTLQPGVYCGGMNFSGAVNVTFAPGVYVIKNGIITETGGSFSGQNVSFFLTGSGASVQLSGQADWHIVAPTSGPMAGFAIFLDPSGPFGLAANASTLSGQSELYFEGIVYLPQQAVTVMGNASVVAPSPYTSYIGDTLTFLGNADLTINNDTSLTKVPIPTALMVQTNGQVTLIQ